MVYEKEEFTHFMSTYMAKKADIRRKWYIIDAAGKPLGRVASAAATILRGKHEPTYTPHADCGDCVIIINSDKAVLTGRKLEQKYHYRYTGWVGNMKATQYKDMMQYRSDKAMELAIKGMLPATTVGRASLTRLRVYKGDEHKQTAQNPIKWERIN